MEQLTQRHYPLNLGLATLAIGHRSLHEHAVPVVHALEQGDEAKARQQAGLMVSRDSKQMAVVGASMESVLENGNDGVFGALFWFIIAGARVGFVHAQDELLTCLAEQLGPWNVSGPARWVATAALSDRAWQSAARLRLPQAGLRLHDLLSRYDLKPQGGCALFQWVTTPKAISLHASLARRGILTRLYNQPCSLRFGLPGREADWQRLQEALEVA